MKYNNILNSKRRNLLITTVGARSINTCKNWIENRANFDVIFIYYDKEFDSNFTSLPDVMIIQLGFKYPTLYNIFSQYPELIDKYDYFFLPDDDVEISSSEIELLFDFAKENGISICQPSIQPVNYSWDITVNNPYTKYRVVSMVEVMCPLFSQKALKICLDTFNQSQSGWGLEPAWKSLLNSEMFKFAIVDSVVAVHSQPISFNSGSLYNALEAKGINPNIELHQMCAKYNSKIEFVNIDFYYKLSSHKKIHNHIVQLNKRLNNFDIKFICLLHLHTCLIHIILKLFIKCKEEIMKFYSLDNDENTSSFDSFFISNESEFQDVFFKVNSNSTNREVSELFMLEKWSILCKDRTYYIWDSSSNEKSAVYSLMSEFSFLMKTHFNLSLFFERLIFYIICNLLKRNCLK